MKFALFAGIGLIISSCAQLQTHQSKRVDPSRTIVKIQAISGDGKQYLGSGVVIAPNTIATNCHVVRKAKRAYIIQPEQRYPVLKEAALPRLDVCLLQTEDLNLPVAKLAISGSVNLGDDIVLAGYPLALGLRMRRGKVTGLFPFQNEDIIEINTGFNHGASGGGVFNSSGKLIGLMTFMGPEAGSFHFYVIPAKWLTMALEQDFVPIKPLNERSFWEKGEFVKHLK